ncbi:LysM peptidoglycan-binding domain-containing protein [Limosilactobacillus sp.]|uniref:C40 family peptidase n=1 Tax=Limosilactobacillus sp. TaxID=2773925 RepID=UPI003F0A105C
MVKKLKRVHQHRHMFVGALGAVGLLTLTAQAASASEVTVKPGDTVWGIAQQHGLTTQAIEAANPTKIKKISSTVDLIQVGQQLTLPDGQSTPAPTQTGSSNGTYAVQPGDQLTAVAQRFGITAGQLRQWNQLTSNQLVAGQQLQVTDPNATAAGETNGDVATAGVGPVTNQGSQPNASTVSGSAVTAEENAATMASGQSLSAPQPTAVTGQQVSGTTPSTVVAGNTDQSTLANTQMVGQNDQVSGQQPTSSLSGEGNQTSSQGPVTFSTQPSTQPVNNSVATSQQPVQSQQSVQSATTPASAAPVSQQPAQPTAGQEQPLASQQPAQSTAGTGQSVVNQQSAGSATSQQSGQSVSDQPASSSPATSNQQPATSTQPAQSSSSTGASDLQTGSVVSLATKIATSNSVPYVWGGNSLKGMDCSGFVDYVYAHAENKQLPHNSVALESYVNQHAVSQAQPGDILFWGNHGSTYHVAIYTGNNQYAAAAKPGTNVSIYTLSPYFTPSFAGTVK